MTGFGLKEVFVYGTLLPGQKYFHMIAPMVASRMSARTQGRLFHLPFGYPALVESDTGWVRGELFRFNQPIERVLEVCDEIEGYRADDEEASLFVRVIKQVEPEAGSAPLEAWCYCLGPARREELLRLGREVSGGDWLAFLKQHPHEGGAAREP